MNWHELASTLANMYHDGFYSGDVILYLQDYLGTEAPPAGTKKEAIHALLTCMLAQESWLGLHIEYAARLAHCLAYGEYPKTIPGGDK